MLAAEVDLELRELQDLAPRVVAPGMHPNAIRVVIHNNGPGRIGSIIGFPGFPLYEDVVVKLYLSENDVFGDRDDTAIGQSTISVYLAAGDTVQITVQGGFNGITIPVTAPGQYRLFAELQHPAGSNRTDSNQGNNRVAMSSPLIVTDAIPDNALELDGVDDLAAAVSTILPDSTSLTSFTVEAWVYPMRRADAFIISDDAYDLTTVIQGGNLAMAFRIRGGPSSSVLSSRHFNYDRVTTNAWSHLALMFDAPTRVLSWAVNGEVFKRDPFTSTQLRDFYSISRDGFTIGGLLTGTAERFKGRIDEARISEGVRYGQNFTPSRRFEFDFDTHALYHFDEPVGATTFYDSSGRGNHLNGLNGATVTVLSIPALLFNPVAKSGLFTVEIRTTAGTSYTLEYKDSLTESVWKSLNSVTGDGATRTLSDSTASSLSRFYRVRAD